MATGNFGSTPPSIPSGTGIKSAAINLTEIRKVGPDYSIQFATPEDENGVWRDILRLLWKPLGQPLSVSDEETIAYEMCPNNIKNVLKHEHENELKFNAKLFTTLRGVLDGLVLIEEVSNLIVFKNTIVHGKYAIGIAKEATKSFTIDKYGMATPCNNPGDTVVEGSAIDHSPCLLAKDSSGNWQVVECLAAVELKSSTSNHCVPLAQGLTGERFYESLSLQSSHSALAQAMMYTVGMVVPSHAKLGQLGDNIPWAVLVGKVIPTAKAKGAPPISPPKSSRWVSGVICIPEQCGGLFKYAVTGSEKLETKDKNESIKNALSVYFKTILFGLKAGLKWLDALRQGNQLHSCPTSGKNVVIFGMEFQDLTLRSRPGGLSLTDPNFGCQWTKASQGEVFSGRLSKGSLKLLNRAGLLVFNNKTMPGDDVVVKVSSAAVHNYLTEMNRTWFALSAIRLTDPTKISEETKSDSPSTTSTKVLSEVPMFSDVLLAVQYLDEVGLVTIMTDLSKQGYVALRPREYNIMAYYNQDYRAALWDAFCQLLESVLLPMANLGIIHPDIRPGWDETANILVKAEQEQDGNRINATMKLIDYESILIHDYWKVPKNPSSLYIKKQANARIFLWWQCVAIAYSWHYAKTQREMSTVTMEEMVPKDKNTRPAWLQNGFFSDDAKDEMEMEMSADLLESVANVFM